MHWHVWVSGTHVPGGGAVHSIISGHCSVLVRAVFGHRADGSISLTLTRDGVYIVAYDTTKPTQTTIAASAKPTMAEARMLSS
jgi:hypothetical protein